MDELINEALDALRVQTGQESVLQLWEVLFALTLSVMCSIVVGHVYRLSHKSIGYSQSYVQTLVLTSLVTTVIMIVIGSNIARAFSLVGALSIIRFRNAIKETRDVGYIFFAMAIAMANGTRFYAVAITATGFICGVMILLHLINFGTRGDDPERMLRVQLPPGVDPESALTPSLRRLFKSYSLVLVETVRQGLYTESLFSVRAKPGITGKAVIEDISKVNDNLKITYNYALHTDEF